MNDTANSKQGQRKVRYGAQLLTKAHHSNVVAKVQYEVRKALAPWLITRSPLHSRSFTLWGNELPYWLHGYNTTWRNERCIEVAAAHRFLDDNPGGRSLEFGNVLANYSGGRLDVMVDLYEHAAGVTNVDINDFVDAQGFDVIVSLSTLEHVGWEEDPQQPEKSLAALAKLRELLRPGGVCLVSVPLGCNPALDDHIRSGNTGALRTASFTRMDGGWSSTDTPVFLPYNSRGPGAATVWIAEFGPVGD